jgi:hypothetical protein
MRKAILGSVGALALATPAFAADLPVQPRYSEVPGYEYRSAPPAVVEELPPVAPETYVVRRPVVVAPPPVVVEEYPVYASPRSMRRLCMRMPAQVGVSDGAIAVTSAAIGERWKGVR